MPDALETAPAPAQSRRRLGRPLALVGLLLIIILLAAVGAAAVAGYQAGVTQRVSAQQATQSAELQLQYDRGVEDLAAGRYEVAIARFEYIVQIDPHYRDASQKLAEARQGLQGGTPAPTAPAASPTPAASATAAPTPSTRAEEIFALAEQYFREGNWDGVIAQVALLHSVDPTFEAVRADGLLYVALRNRGVERIQRGDAMEAGIFDLDQAEAFGPLDTEALNQRAWARLYLAALSYWGVNWQQAMRILQDLYLIAPYFHDTNKRLFEATVNYADQLRAAGDDCAAAEHYGQALAILADEAVAAALAESEAACQAGPGEGTPGPGEEGTPAAEETSQP
jgi:tetratricopeptide (TPR) repeat protein